MPGGERRHLIQEEQRGVVFAHRVMLLPLVVDVATDPMARCPPAFPERAIITMKLAAPIAIMVPRAGVATISPKGVTRSAGAWLILSRSCQDATASRQSLTGER